MKEVYDNFATEPDPKDDYTFYLNTSVAFWSDIKL
jgi:hypothetical protein